MRERTRGNPQGDGECALKPDASEDRRVRNARDRSPYVSRPRGPQLALARFDMLDCDAAPHPGVNDVDTRATRFDRDTFATLLVARIVESVRPLRSAGVVTEGRVVAQLGSISNSFPDAVVV